MIILSIYQLSLDYVMIQSLEPAKLKFFLTHQQFDYFFSHPAPNRKISSPASISNCFVEYHENVYFREWDCDL